MGWHRGAGRPTLGCEVRIVDADEARIAQAVLGNRQLMVS